MIELHYIPGEDSTVLVGTIILSLKTHSIVPKLILHSPDIHL